MVPVCVICRQYSLGWFGQYRERNIDEQLEAEKRARKERLECV